METIFTNDKKIKLYAKIQKKLCFLEPNSGDDKIEEIFQLLPPNYLDEKENLIMICQLFGIIGRCRRKMGRIVIKLFEKIKNIIKRDLSDDSSILWNIFGGCFYFKFLMYQEGLINIEHIILSAQSDKTSKTTEYFLPEIIERDLELFEKEIKYKHPCFLSPNSYSQESIQKFVSLRNKHLKWLKESANFFDDFYQEIETDPLRLSIKRNDVFSFQKVLSQTNLSINSVIYESTIENFLRVQVDLHLIDYALNYEAFDIFKFLLMNGAELNLHSIVYSIQSGNYDAIHLIETKMAEKFEKYSIMYAIGSWNHEIIKYIIENYNFDFLKKGENDGQIENNQNQEDENIAVDNNDDTNIISIISNTFYCFNFRFFKSFLLPFFRKNPKFVKKNINEIIIKSLEDMSFYFTKELIQYPEIDINYTSPDQRKSFLLLAVDFNNSTAVNNLLKNPKIDVNGNTFYSPLFYACANFSDMKIIEMLIHHPKINFDFREPQFNDSVFQIAMIRGNAYAMKLLIKSFPNIEIDNIYDDITFCIRLNHLMTLKIFINFLKTRYKNANFDQIIDNCKQYLIQNGDDETFCNILSNIVDEVNDNK